jgi:hypothetical protein
MIVPHARLKLARISGSILGPSIRNIIAPRRLSVFIENEVLRAKVGYEPAALIRDDDIDADAIDDGAEVRQILPSLLLLRLVSLVQPVLGWLLRLIRGSDSRSEKENCRPAKAGSPVTRGGRLWP